jgi:hypothetical protein
MTFIQLLELIKTLCVSHPDIKGFYTGTKSSKDSSIIEHPAVRVILPFSGVPSDESDSLPMSLKLTLAIRVNKAVIEVGAQNMEVNINNLTENATINEINSDIALVNALRGKALRISSHLIEWLKLSEDSFEYFKIGTVSIKGVENVDIDYSTGVDVSIEFLLGNPYICEARQLFKDNVIL